MDFCLNQTCVYWENLGPDGYGGSTWEDPVELDCRWEEVTERFIDANGEERRSQAKVFLGQDVNEGDYLYLGDLDDLTSADSPGNTKGAFQVRSFKKVPDLSGTEFERKAWL